MADGGRHDVLGQKAQAAQRAYDARGMSPAKALKRALSRTTDLLWDLALVTQSVHVEMLDQDGVVDGLAKTDLLLLLDGPEGALGVVAVDRQVMTGLIEVQTIQQVTQMPIEEDRVVTPTDAAMVAPLIDGALAQMAESLADSPLHFQIDGYRFGAQIEDPRAASLLLDAAAYRAFRADVDLALGRRKGRVSIILPDRKPKRRNTQQAEDDPGPYSDLLSRVPARLDAVLTRITLPLSRAGTLKPGDMLRLSPDALDRVEVFAGQGHLVAKGRLGQLNGCRAVRLTWPVVGPVAKPNAQDETPLDLDMTETNPMDEGAAASLAEIPALPSLPQIEADPMAEELPDLPPLDFEADANDCDIDALNDGPGPMPNENSALPDIDLSDGFASAPMDISFDD